MRRRKSLRLEVMPSWIAPVFPFRSNPYFPISRFLGSQRHEDLRGIGEQEGFPASLSTSDTLLPPHGDSMARAPSSPHILHRGLPIEVLTAPLPFCSCPPRRDIKNGFQSSPTQMGRKKGRGHGGKLGQVAVGERRAAMEAVPHQTEGGLTPPFCPGFSHSLIFHCFFPEPHDR